MFTNIIRLSVKIAKCQKSLLNYEEALVILKTCHKQLKKKNDKQEGYILQFFQVSIEYIEILVLLHRLEEAHNVGQCDDSL